MRMRNELIDDKRTVLLLRMVGEGAVVDGQQVVHQGLVRPVVDGGGHGVEPPVHYHHLAPLRCGAAGG